MTIIDIEDARNLRRRAEQVAGRRARPIAPGIVEPVPGADGPGPRDRLAQMLEVMEQDYTTWLAVMFARYFTNSRAEYIPMAPHHHAFWRHLWGIQRGHRPRPFVEILPRGGGKSTMMEQGIVALGARRQRSYVPYVSSTQQRADDHIQNGVAALLEHPSISAFYPLMSERLVTKYGSSKGWRRNRMRTASGLTVDALGLDVTTRGVKMEAQRPDVIIFDDIDEAGETDKSVRRKQSIITMDILPAASDDCAIFFLQNLIHRRGLASLLMGMHPEPEVLEDFMMDRLCVGPIPAVTNLEYESYKDEDQENRVKWRITSGQATWAGMDIERCTNIMNSEGITAFLSERQHAMPDPKGGMFDHLPFDDMLVDFKQIPEVYTTELWVDPATTANDGSDACGISVGSYGIDDKIYILYSWEQRSTPRETMRHAWRKAIEYGADAVGIETDQGGDTWSSVADQAWDDLVSDPGEVDFAEETFRPTLKFARAGTVGESKIHRASMMLFEYERDRFRHLRGTHNTAFGALTRFPRSKPYDYTDGQVWLMRSLLKMDDEQQGARGSLAQATTRGW